MCQYANNNGGILITNDRMEDVMRDYPQFEDQIKRRKLRFTFIDDEFQLPQDAGKNSSKTLDQYLRF